MKRTLLFCCCGLVLVAWFITAPSVGQGTSAWSHQTSGTTNELRSVFFTNQMEGWAAGANATLLKTIDGGVNWGAVNTGVEPARGFNTVQFLDRNTGIAGGSLSLARTTDGGTTWISAALPDSQPGGLNNIVYNSFSPLQIPLSTATIGCGSAEVAGLKGRLCEQYSFSSQGALTRDAAFASFSAPAILDVQFFYTNEIVDGWVVGTDGFIARYNRTPPSYLQNQTSGVREQLNGIRVLPSDARRVAWIVGNNGTILKTTDGGNNWTAQSSGTTAHLRDVHFLNANRGWVVGDGGVILTTSDGGTTWSSDSSGTTANLRGVFFVNENTGYAVGDNGTILKRGGSAVPTTLTTISAASFSGSELTAESIAAGFGQGLAAATENANTAPLPTTLAGTSVKLKDSAGVERLAPLFFVSPGQINYLVPAGTATGAATVTVMRGNTVSATGSLNIVAVAPGLFAANANGQGLAAAVALRVKADNSQSFEVVARFDPSANRFVAVPVDLGPATDRVFLLLFGTGFRNRSGPSGVSARVGGVAAEVSFAGAQGDLAGLDQANVLLPRTLLGRGEVDVVLLVDGKTANTVRVSIGGAAVNPVPVISNVTINKPTFANGVATLSGRFDFTDADGDIAFNGALTNSAKLRFRIFDVLTCGTLEITGAFLSLRGQTAGTVNFTVSYNFRSAVFLQSNLDFQLVDLAGNASAPVRSQVEQWFCQWREPEAQPPVQPWAALLPNRRRWREES